MSKTSPNKEVGIAFGHAHYPTRCMVCALPIARGSLIGTLADPKRLIVEKKSKAKWAHPRCLTKALGAHEEVSRELARMAYSKRMFWRRKRSS